MENIDRIFFINLDKRTDRLAEFTAECKKINLPMEKIERFSAISVPTKPYLGCTTSHLEVIKLAKDRGYSNVLIFEDDFEFLVDSDLLEKRLSDFFNKKLDFKVLMLAYHVIESKPFDEFVSTTTNAQTGSGYIVNCRYFDELIDTFEFGCKMLTLTDSHWLYINDQVWKKLQGDK